MITFVDCSCCWKAWVCDS